jgi:serine/threonine protein kinase
MAQFSHPNIVPVYDFGEVNGSPYLVMEYIPGGTLKDKTGHPVPVETAISWIAPIADALAYAHEFGVVHRDVKPSNILFDQKGRPILTDFGVAKVLETDEATLTGTGMGVGTPEYMAPEQWRGKTCPATDQYALGVVLYELLTGRKPYAADTPAALVILQATEPLQQPSKLVMDIPEEIEKLLFKVLALEPQHRFQDMETFSKAVRLRLVDAEARKPTPGLRNNRPTKTPPVMNEDVSSENFTLDAVESVQIEETNQPPSSGKNDNQIEENHNGPKQLFGDFGYNSNGIYFLGKYPKNQLTNEKRNTFLGKISTNLNQNEIRLILYILFTILILYLAFS